MLDIGFSEILVIVGLALVVLGPTKLPQVARTIGRWAGRARAMARQFQEQLENETGELKGNLDSVKTTMNEMRDAATAAVSPTSAAQGAAPPQSPPPAEPAPQAQPAPTAQPVDEFAARDARTTPEAMHAADPPPPPKDASP